VITDAGQNQSEAKWLCRCSVRGTYPMCPSAEGADRMSAAHNTLVIASHAMGRRDLAFVSRLRSTRRGYGCRNHRGFDTKRKMKYVVSGLLP
jgi:hypothetical protein